MDVFQFCVWLLKLGSVLKFTGDYDGGNELNTELNTGGTESGHYVETRAGDVATMEQPSVEYYRAAVYEHAVYLPELEETPLTRHRALEEMMKNIRVFQIQAREAAEQGADIIVFPEDGVYGMKFLTRDQIFPFLEYIPEIDVQWNPCTQPGLYRDTDIQTYLSCMAKDNGLYVVANIGDVQPCNRPHDPKCPNDGRYQFNTNVVYGPDGAYITKYHKYNLFFEFQFDTPNTCDITTFNTHFGKFGVFTCFDILFEDPPVTLVQGYNITDVIFTTAWMDAAPFLTSIQYHSSFAMANGINLLAANIHRPSERFHGSGIYTPDGAAAYYYNTSEQSPGKLIVARIPIINQTHDQYVHKKKREENTYIPISPIVTESDDKEFVVRMFSDMHHAVPLLESSGTGFVCHTDLCCNVTYTLSHQETISNELDSKLNETFFALAAYDGLHKDARYYMQICSIVRCHKSVTGTTCGSPYLPRQSTNQSLTSQPNHKSDMTSFTLSGNFSTEYIYPQILLEDDLDLELTPYPRQWTYNNGRMTSLQQYNKPLNVASLFGRYYQKDLLKAVKETG